MEDYIRVIADDLAALYVTGAIRELHALCWQRRGFPAK
jgi:hypothetical protein